MSSNVIKIHVAKPHPVLTPLWELFERAKREVKIHGYDLINYGTLGEAGSSIVEQIKALDTHPIATVSDYPYQVIANAIFYRSLNEHPKLKFNDPYTFTAGCAISINGLPHIRVDQQLDIASCRVTLYGTTRDTFDIKLDYTAPMAFSGSESNATGRLA